MIIIIPQKLLSKTTTKFFHQTTQILLKANKSYTTKNIHYDQIKKISKRVEKKVQIQHSDLVSDFYVLLRLREIPRVNGGPQIGGGAAPTSAFRRPLSTRPLAPHPST